MNRKEYLPLDQSDEDEMPMEVDFSKAVRGNFAYQAGEHRPDEILVERFWQSLGLEVEFIAEPYVKRSMAPDLLLKREGTPCATCEIKSMAEFDHTVTLVHDDGTRTTTQHASDQSTSDRILRLANRAAEQLSYSNPDHTLANIFVFINRDANAHMEEVQSQLLAIPAIDATLWFQGGIGSASKEPVVIASAYGQERLTLQLGLALETRLKLISAA